MADHHQFMIIPHSGHRHQITTIRGVLDSDHPKSTPLLCAIGRYGRSFAKSATGHTEQIRVILSLSLIHISEPTRLRRISYAVFCLKKKKKKKQKKKKQSEQK